MQNLPIAEGTIIFKFPLIQSSAKEVGKLEEDKGCLHCFHFNQHLALPNLFLIVFEKVESDSYDAAEITTRTQGTRT